MLAIDYIHDRADVQKRNGTYTDIQASKDESLLYFFKNWADAEVNYWVDKENRNTKMGGFSNRFPWFNDRFNGVLKIFGL